MPPHSSPSFWAATVLALSGLPLEPGCVADWEASVPPLTLDEQADWIALPMGSPSGLRLPESSGPGPEPELGCAAELNRWQRWFLDPTHPARRNGTDAPDDFARQAYVNARRAQMYLGGQRLLIPVLDALRSTHSMLFCGCPWSGGVEPRARLTPAASAGDDTTFGQMDQLATTALELFRSAKGAWQQAEAIAFYHADFLRLRPFIEGNHLLALLVAGTQLDIVFGPRTGRAVDASAYAAAMTHVAKRVTMVPLTRWFHSLVAATTPLPLSHQPCSYAWRLSCRRPPPRR